MDQGKYLGSHARRRQLLYEREEAYNTYYLALKDATKALQDGLVKEAMA